MTMETLIGFTANELIGIRTIMNTHNLSTDELLKCLDLEKVRKLEIKTLEDRLEFLKLLDK